MKKCPFCAEMILDEAVKCRFCGEFLDQNAAPQVRADTPLLAPEKVAEIRRLQRIASGRPTRTDNMRKVKGILYLMIIAAILIYSWHWKRLHEGRAAPPATQSAITFESFNAIFGPQSTLSLEDKQREFEFYRGKTAVWDGTVVYVNHGEGPELYMTVNSRASTGTSDVLVRFNRKNRDHLEGLRVGETVKYRGRIVDFGAKTSFITLSNGAILSIR